jgi:hypothetical protein
MPNEVTTALWREDLVKVNVKYVLLKFDVHVTVHRDKFLIIETNRCTNFSIIFKFWNETLHVSDSFSVHHQGFSTVHTAMVYIIHTCWQLAICQHTCVTYTIAVCTVENS